MRLCTPLPLPVLAMLAALACTVPLSAQPVEPTPSVTSAAAATAPTLTLKSLFELAWAQQPEAQALATRRQVAQATLAGNTAWTAEPPALLLQAQTDRPGAGQGSREYELGLALPLWLPGQRQRASALSEAELRAVESRAAAQQWRLAARVREAWWQHHRGQSEWDLAQARLGHAQQIALDVGRRVKAGDLSRADQHQADAALAQAESALAEAQGTRDAALSSLKGMAGWDAPVALPTSASPEAMPEARQASMPLDAPLDEHPALAELMDRQAVAQGIVDLSLASQRANTELTLLTTRSRGQSTEPYRQSITLGIRLPFGAGKRADARTAAAQADVLEVHASTALARASLNADISAAQALLTSAQAQLKAAERQARLARESRIFFDKSFRLGQTDLPTRLRIEQEATQAEQRLSRARMDAASAVSSLRQALGLLPQ